MKYGQFLLFESASGYGLLEVIEAEDIGLETREVMEAVVDYVRFARMVRLKAFVPFSSAEEALENIHAVSEGEVPGLLVSFLEANLPGMGKQKRRKEKKAGRKKGGGDGEGDDEDGDEDEDEDDKDGGKKGSAVVRIGVHDAKIGAPLQEALGRRVAVSADERVAELLRGVRMHFARLHGDIGPQDLIKAQLGLAHAFSRSKVKFNVHKVDNMIIQSIALLDQLEKDVNTFAMRAREWYSWHFPELVKIVTDNYQYARCVRVIGNKSSASEDSLGPLTDVLGDEDKAREVVDAAKTSMGTDVSELDLANIDSFAQRVVELADFRKGLHSYLVSKMKNVAPNLASLIGEQVAARLISHAGSLTNLAKYPASTVQILGAEKALFRALKTKGKTPKYGLLFHSTFIGRAKQKNKGRISRYLANKCSIASRVDCFSESSSDVYGRKLREQLEERLLFYETGATPRKNLDVMREAMEAARVENIEDDDNQNTSRLPETVRESKDHKKKSKRKRSHGKVPSRHDEDENNAEEDDVEEGGNDERPKKNRSSSRDNHEEPDRESKKKRRKSSKGKDEERDRSKRKSSDAK